MEERGRVVAISVSRHQRIKKSNVPSARLVEDFGIEGDAHAGKWTRQVSLMSLASIQKMVDLGLNVGPGDFAENITTDGIDLLAIPVGTRLKVGGEAILEVTQIGKVCHTPCAIYYQVGTCIFPTEGIFARVLQGGEIKAGDDIKIVEKDGEPCCEAVSSAVIAKPTPAKRLGGSAPSSLAESGLKQSQKGQEHDLG